MAGVPRTFRELNRSLQLLGELRAQGWQRSVRMRRAVAHSGSPLPWFTYPAIRWLEPRVAGTDRIFEFGAGSSTLWFSRHAESIISIEHDPTWASFVRQSLGPPNELHLKTSGTDSAASPYVAAIRDYPDGAFDVIVVDGEHRPACAIEAVPKLNKSGILIIDDTNWPSLANVVARLNDAGLWRIDFEGLNPGLGTLSATSVFGRGDARWLRDSVPVRDTGW